MSAFYQIYGTIRVRKCPESEAIIARLPDDPVGEIEVEVNECDPDVLAVSVEGGGFFSADGISELDDLLKSLGPHAVEPAVLVTHYEDEEGELIVARSDAESKEMLSRHRVDQIEVLLRDVTPEDRARLVEKLQAP